MKTLECIELIQLADESGIFSDESRWDVGTMTQVLNSSRAYVIAEIYRKDNRVHPNFYQRFYPEYSEDLQQNKCNTLFNIPSVVRINNQMDGLSYVGGIDGDESFKKIRTRMDYNSRMRHRISRMLIETEPHFLNDTTRKYLEVFKPVKHILVEGIFEDPTSVPGFNIQEDDYPITNAAMKRVEDMVRTGTLRESVRMPMNNKPNSQEDSSVAKDTMVR